jgi:glycosyltransferase involved in cell wall biosynthesis
MTDTNLRVAIVHRYFWPQNYPYANMLKDIVEAVATARVDASVYTSSLGEDKETKLRTEWQKHNNIKIFSTRLTSERQVTVVRKAFNAIWFGFWLIAKLLLSKHDIVMVATTPPVIIAFLVTLLSKVKGFRVIYHCQDIHPEALVVNGSIKFSIITKLLAKLDKVTVENAWRVIVLSKDMKRTLTNRGIDGQNIRVINNFVFHTLGTGDGLKNETQIRQDQSKVRFIFAGSLGRFQNLECLLQGIAKHKNNPDVSFLFLGDGPLKNKIMLFVEQEKLSNVSLKSHVPIEEALETMQSFDIGIVSLSHGVSNVAYPSKSIMYMSVGLPIFAVLDTDSEISKMLVEKSFGICVEPDSTAIASGIALMVDSVKNNAFSRDKIKIYAVSEFGKSVILEKITNLIMEKCK